MMLDHSIPEDLARRPHWSPELVAELQAAGTNGRVGNQLVSETAQYRVWLLTLQPGERLPFHTHVMDYFWTATSAGRARSRYADGRVEEPTYELGTTRHFSFATGESMTHDLENIGDTVLSFTTVEDKRGLNLPLAL
jgi:mannose-6-phosphate isomerase-like protein (cupin superfamily)